MKIAQIITLASLGGAQTVLQELSNELSRKGHNVTVISQPEGELWNLLDPSISKITCRYFKRHISLINDIKAILFLRKKDMI